MAISASDPYYRAETTPASIARLGAGLRAAYGQPAGSFGAKGNLAHASGYHRSRTWVLRSQDSRYGARDYSVQKDLDLTGPASDVSAFDFTPGEWGSPGNRRAMVVLTTRVYHAALARDPRLSSLREFAGTLDGRTVATFNCADGSRRDPFDLSHLDHVHGSFWRSRAAADHSGVLAVLLGTPPEGEEDMSDFSDSDPNAWTQARRTEAIYRNADIVDDKVTSPEPNGLRKALDGLKAQNETIIQLLSGQTPNLPAEGGPVVVSDADVARIAEATADELHRRGAE